MICMSNKYIKGVGSSFNQSKNAISQSDKKAFNIVLDDYKIVFKKARNGSMRVDSVKIDAFCVNPEFKALRGRKVTVIKEIEKSKYQNSLRMSIDYQKTIRIALKRIQRHLKSEKEAFSPIASELEKYADNFPVLTFLNKIFAKSVRI